MKHTCSRNLTQHIQLLKIQKNHITVLQENGYAVSNDTISEYLYHYRYVKALLQKEKFKNYNNILKQHLTNRK